MIRTLMAAILAVAFSTAAMAADWYPPAPAFRSAPVPFTHSWTGAYVGVNVGYGWGNGTTETPYQSDTIKIRGYTAGAQAGYNWQVSQFILGFEGSYQFAGLKGSEATEPCPGCLSTSTFKVKNFWTFGGRLGYDINGTLPYVGAGFATADVETLSDLSFGGMALASSKRSLSANGYYLQAGIEQRLSPNWSARIDAKLLKLDAGRLEDSFGFWADNEIEAKVINFGINYRWN